MFLSLDMGKSYVSKLLAVAVCRVPRALQCKRDFVVCVLSAASVDMWARADISSNALLPFEQTLEH